MKLNLQSDRKKIRRYIMKRVRDYPYYTNLGPGDDEDSIARITIGFYAEQGGYVTVVFDTRPEAGPHLGFDGEWTLWIYDDTMLELPKWVDACEAICNGKTVNVVRHDGKIEKLDGDKGSDRIDACFGEMLVDLMLELCDDGTLAQLPLSANAYMVVEEFNESFFWPQPGEKSWGDRKTQQKIVRLGRIDR
ncbi:hypothetical protein CA13_09480 [Planctomycetes bacterium CA13]|uniref:Uncharacterized protein n=1 Tax=Novipirellula herctigrandis TaxID=2527986 RepID=A0A5C5YWY2_9BACT|nr:hypothetical protein CA13_09480 [Planctomycetes bacterium CA13]